MLSCTAHTDKDAGKCTVSSSRSTWVKQGLGVCAGGMHLTHATHTTMSRTWFLISAKSHSNVDHTNEEDTQASEKGEGCHAAESFRVLLSLPLNKKVRLNIGSEWINTEVNRKLKIMEGEDVLGSCKERNNSQERDVYVCVGKVLAEECIFLNLGDK